MAAIVADMLIVRGQIWFGADGVLLWHAIRRIKDQLGGFHPDDEQTLTLDLFAESIGAPLEETAPVVSQLVDAKWLTPKAGEPHTYIINAPFQQFSAARVGQRPLKRTRAREFLDRIVAEARAINREVDNYELDVVTHVLVFGSYLNEDKQELGDLDIAYASARRPRPNGVSLPRRSYHEIVADWRRRSPLELRLGLRSPYISVCDANSINIGKFPYRVVYRIDQDMPELAEQVRSAGAKTSTPQSIDEELNKKFG
jgi:predicted nucleotidyltransferase